MNNSSISFAFDRRYFTVAVLTYITATHTALNLSFISEIPEQLYLAYAAGFICVLAVLCAALCLILRAKREISALIFAATAVSVIFILGVTRVYCFNREYDRRHELMLSHPQICGMVKSEPKLSDSGKSYGFSLDVYSAESKHEIVDMPKRFLIRMYIPADALPRVPEIGDTINCYLGFEIASKPVFDGAFDYCRYLLQSKTAYTGYTYDSEFGNPLPPRNGIFSTLEGAGLVVRRMILNSTDSFPYGEDERALLRGILVGDKDAFSDELYNAYQSAGFIHIASVSGMHISYLFMAVSVLLGLFRFPKRAVCIIAIPILIMFAAVSMFTPSVSRAATMTIIFLIATALRRSNDSITALSAAALVLTLNNPYCTESYSFLLSFGATLGILIFYRPLRRRFSCRAIESTSSHDAKRTKPFPLKCCSKVFGAISDSVCISLSATIGLGFFMARFFGRLQWGSIFGNIIVIPMTACAFIGGYINFAIGSFAPTIAYHTAKFAVNPILRAINAVTAYFSNEIFGFRVPCPSKGFFLVYIVLCAALYILLLPNKEKRQLL